jgi:hypothetical protein
VCVCVSSIFILVGENPKLDSVLTPLVDKHKQISVAH